MSNAAKAAGFSPKTAYSAGGRLLKDVEVAQAIQSRTLEALERAKLTADEVLEDSAQVKRFDPRKLYNPDGSMKLITELPEEIALHLEGVEFQEVTVGDKAVGRVAKVKFPKKSVVRE